MCVVSNITTPWMQDPTPFWQPPIVPMVPAPWQPQTWPLPPIQQIPPEIAQQLLDVIGRLEKIDKALGLLDCKVEKIEKDKIKRKLRRRAAKKVKK